MKKLGDRNYLLISEGIKATGSYDPNEVFPYIEENLYMHESDTIWEFLQWCHDGGTEPHPHIPTLNLPKRGFGRGNYEERFKEFKKSLVVSN